MPTHYDQRKTPSKPIMKLQVDLGKGKSGTILIRIGDNPEALAKNFAKTFSLKPGMEQQIEAKIREQLYLYYTQQVTTESSPIQIPLSSQVTKPVTSLRKSKLLFNMEVEIEEGKTAVLPVPEGMEPKQLAKQFALQHQLNSEAERALVTILNHHLKDYYATNFE